MITEVTGDLLADDADVLVNPVNCVGVMGKGLALQFKNKYPSAFTAYKAYCDSGQLNPGHIFTYKLVGGPYIAHFPTKRHWRDPSRLVWISMGLRELSAVLRDLQASSVALPALGAGLGGLNWNMVKLVIHHHLGSLAWIDVRLYVPESCTGFPGGSRT